MKKNLKNKKKGFTLIELIIVIAIIAIIAAIAIPKFGDVRSNAALNSDIANAKTIANAASALIADGTIPTAKAEDIVIDRTKDTEDTIANAIEGFLQNVPLPETSGYDNYVVDIDDNGNVTVSMKGTGDKKETLYPRNNSENNSENK